MYLEVIGTTLPQFILLCIILGGGFAALLSTYSGELLGLRRLRSGVPPAGRQPAAPEMPQLWGHKSGRQYCSGRRVRRGDLYLPRLRQKGHDVGWGGT